MKKSLICVVLLTLLSLGGVTALHLTLTDSAEQVEITQQDLYGDPAAADGLVVRRQTELRSDLSMCWDTTYPVNGTPETEYAFRMADRRYEPESKLLFFSSSFNCGYAGLWEYPITDEDIPLRELYNTVAANTPAGQTHSQILRVADYLDTVPLEINYRYLLPDQDGQLRHYTIHSEELDFYTSGMDRDSFEAQRIHFAHELVDSFRFPIPEDFTVEVSVSRDLDGAIYDMQCSALDNSLGVETLSVGTTDWIYFILSAYDEGGKPTSDYSGTPAGFGLYRLPVSDPKDLTLADLELALPLEPGLRVTNLDITPDRDRLLLSTEEEGRCVLRVLDAAQCTLLQTLELDEAEPDSWTAAMAYEGFALVTLSNGYRVLEEQADGTYRPRFLALNPDLSAYSQLERSYSFLPAFDGTRLAILRGLGSDYGEMCGFSLMVYNEKGLQYIGVFENSLDVGRQWDGLYNALVYPVRDGTSLRWS